MENNIVPDKYTQKLSSLIGYLQKQSEKYDNHNFQYPLKKFDCLGWKLTSEIKENINYIKKILKMYIVPTNEMTNVKNIINMIIDTYYNEYKPVNISETIYDYGIDVQKALIEKERNKYVKKLEDKLKQYMTTLDASIGFNSIIKIIITDYCVEDAKYIPIIQSSKDDILQYGYTEYGKYNGNVLNYSRDNEKIMSVYFYDNGEILERIIYATKSTYIGEIVIRKDKLYKVYLLGRCNGVYKIDKKDVIIRKIGDGDDYGVGITLKVMKEEDKKTVTKRFYRK